MWYHKEKKISVKSPTRTERISLRLMILIGSISAFLFLYVVFKEEHVGYAPLYYLLCFTFCFLVLKILYEWYNYWSISRPSTPPEVPELSVDIFTTFMPGEPYEMITETLEAIQQITYPHTAYLCDEADDPYLKEVCARLGVIHVTRTEKINAKAGNINNALNRATGDICLVLDPDHVPAPDFIDTVLPHFADEKIGFVQVVQAYNNFSESLVAKGSAQQTFQFYGPMMMCMNGYGTAQAIGANCTFRRKALDSIGGHAPGLAEDMNTSMQLHANGWRSVYVPEVVSRGLVPSTISAYYKQQLKWSRGVFELLFTTFIRHFWQFTWRQKLHYSLLPWHYFGSFVFLINFLIPVLSLVLGIMPMTMDFSHFLLISTPFLMSTIVIRHYVQRWVMEEKERGTHLLGGTLLIGTWWIHLLGIFFTLLRRKVPYDPTPKDGKEGKLGKIILPNLLVALLSIAAIVFGLNRDFNPFSLVMAFFALINAGIMIANIFIALQWEIRRLELRYNWLNWLSQKLVQFKDPYWRFRHSIYSYIRIAALPLILILMSALYYYNSTTKIRNLNLNPSAPIEKVFYLGFYAPDNGDGLSSFEVVEDLEEKAEINSSIISSYLGWQPGNKGQLPTKHLNQIYARGAYPMLTWEPWLNSFPRWDSLADRSFFKAIHQGHFDDYIRQTAIEFRELKKPIFVRFGHEPDNPAYPWYDDSDSAATNFKLAWSHVRKIFRQNGAQNAIWVYNPWKAENADNYFPGIQEVDWIGVTALNYGDALFAKNWQSFEKLYSPFHRSLSFQSGLPVMLAEFGSLASTDTSRNSNWYSQAMKNINDEFPEIQSVIFFASPSDKNLSGLQSEQALNWRGNAPQFKQLASLSTDFQKPQRVHTDTAAKLSGNFTYRDFYQQLNGVNYNPGLNWRHSKHPLFRRKISDDFKAMKPLHINTILRFGPTVYDQNIFEEATDKDLEIIYAFWIPKGVNWEEDSRQMQQIKKDILKTVNRFSDREVIRAWHIAPSPLKQIEQSWAAPLSLYQQEAFLSWLGELVEEMKMISDKPISLELTPGVNLEVMAQNVLKFAPRINAFGIRQGEEEFIPVSPLPRPVFYSSYQADHVKQVKEEGKIYANWQNDVYSGGLNLDGLLGFRGLPNQNYRQLKGTENGEALPAVYPEFSVIVPADMPTEGNKLTYRAAIKRPLQDWSPLGRESVMEVSWHLVKTDDFGNPFALEELNQGPWATLIVPAEPQRYKILLTARYKGQVFEKMVPLSNSVYYGESLQPLSRDQIDYHLKKSRE